MREALRAHWPEYLIEAWGSTFIISAGLFTTLVEYPGSPVAQRSTRLITGGEAMH